MVQSIKFFNSVDLCQEFEVTHMSTCKLLIDTQVLTETHLTLANHSVIENEEFKSPNVFDTKWNRSLWECRKTPFKYNSYYLIIIIPEKCYK